MPTLKRFTVDLDIDIDANLMLMRFKHFKGTTYMVVRAVFDATADSWMVGYVKKGDDGNGTLFTRTYEDFTSKVERPRFEEV